MPKNDSPAGSAGGPVALPELDNLPEKMRVHALAKLIGVTSREVLAALDGLGHEARSAQSSIERKVVEQIIVAFVPGPADPEPELEAAPEVAGLSDEPTAALAPLFAPATPLFQAPVRPAEGAASPDEPPASRRGRRGKSEPAVAAPAEETADE